MRLSGGTAKGRKITVPGSSRGKKPELPLRPTSAKVRKAVFDILQGEVEGCRFLDLFAGTGAVGFDALSRDAGHVVFVERDPVLASEIGRLAKHMHFETRCSIVEMPADVFLLGRTGTFNIIFADPPYATGDSDTVLALLGERRVTEPGGIIIIEHSARKAIPDMPGILTMKKRYLYGDTALSVYRMPVSGRKDTDS